MNNVVFNFLASRPNDKNHSRILVVKGKHVVEVDKKELSKLTLILAKLGFGHASLKSVAGHVKKFKGQMEAGTHLRFNRYLERYNNGKVLWKRGVIVLPSSLKKGSHYRAEALFFKILAAYKINPPLDTLIARIHKLSKAISELDPNDKKMNKQLFIEILEMKAQMNQLSKNNEALKDALKQLQASVLKVHFAKRLARMDEVLTQIERRFKQHKDIFSDKELL